MKKKKKTKNRQQKWVNIPVKGEVDSIYKQTNKENKIISDVNKWKRNKQDGMIGRGVCGEGEEMIKESLYRKKIFELRLENWRHS